MTYHDEKWLREVSLLRATVLTEVLIKSLGLPDPSKNWVPESFLPLFGSDLYASLSHEQCLRYNHAYARQLAAEFVWLERYLIRPPLLRLLGSAQLEKEIMLVLCSFIADETSHIASFEVLGRAAAAAEKPPIVIASKHFSPPRLVRQLASWGARFPLQLKFWSDVIIPLEEKAIIIGQAYMRDENVDRVFKEAFINHARDEARHCRLDGLFSEWLGSNSSTIMTLTNKRLGQIFQRAYYDDSWGLEGPINELVAAFPQLADRQSQLVATTKMMREKLTSAAQN